MELADGMYDQSAAGIPAPASTGKSVTQMPTPDLAHADTGARLDAATSTTMLRRCTALATRARVELLSPGPRPAARELAVLLGEMEHWEPASLEDPDPTMSVLASAALQDLAERLRDPASAALATSARTVLEVLRELMATPRVNVPA